MDVTILINSCDLYEDAWYPFLKLLRIQWPELKYDIVINTEMKVFQNDEFQDVRTICGGQKPWADRVLNAIDNIETEYILFFLEDQFLREPVSNEWFEKSLSYMKDNDDVGAIILRHTEKQQKEFKEDFFLRSEVTNKMPIVAMTALYRKQYLQKLLKSGESAWDFETKGSERSKMMNEKVLQYNNSRPALFVYDDKIEKGYGITHRKWLPGNKQLFEKYGINVNFENLGFFDVDEYFALKSRKETISSNKNIIERLYNFKKKLKSK